MVGVVRDDVAGRGRRATRCYATGARSLPPMVRNTYRTSRRLPRRLVCEADPSCPQFPWPGFTRLDRSVQHELPQWQT